MTSIEIPDPIITTDYHFVGNWATDDIRFVGEVLINSIVVYEGPDMEDSRESEERALDGFAHKIKELLK